MIGTILYKVEITFWDLIIRLLSESMFIRRLIRNISMFLKKNNIFSINKIIDIIAISVFISGCLLYLIKILIH